MRNTLAIAKKELNIYFTTPLAYAMFAVMTVFASYFFIAAVKQFLDYSMTAMQMPQYVDSRVLNLTDYVVAPVVFNSGIIVAMIAPFLSMRLIAEEKRQRTFELLLTSPIRPLEIVLGKYLGGLVIMAITLGITLLHPLILHLFAGSTGAGGGVEWQTTLTAYFGLFLWAAAAMAIGLFISALTDSQAVAAIISILLLLLLWLASWMASGTDGVMREVLTSLSASQHLVAFVKGVFDVKDLVYYASWIVLGLFLTHRAVEAQRWS